MDTENKQLTAEKILTSKIMEYNNTANEMSKFLLNKKEVKLFAVAMQEYSAQQNAELIKEVQELKMELIGCSSAAFKIQLDNDELIKKTKELSGIIESQKQTAGALIKKYNELKAVADKMAEALKRYTPEKAREVISEWDKLNK